jgi:scyllo-inositol 2-dehydrogenase (NADP+)
MRAGIVGYGLAGRYFHATTLVSAGFDVAAICTRSLERKAAAHQDFPGAILVNSVDELVAEDLDLIVIASTNDVHAEHARTSINAGIATVVDKPMGRDYYETVALFDHADMRGVPLTVFFNRLWDSDSLTIKKALREGVLGNVFRCDSRFERFRPDVNPEAWRENSSIEAGGGLLLDLQTHLVSTALDWFGPAELVHASVRDIRGVADDDVVLVLQHESGVDSYLSVSAIIGAPGPKLRLNGDKGSLVIQDLDNQEEILRKGFIPRPGEWISRDEIRSEARIFKGADSFSYPSEPGSYPSFYSKVRESFEIGSPLPVSRDFALNVARIIDKAREISIR